MKRLVLLFVAMLLLGAVSVASAQEQGASAQLIDLGNTGITGTATISDTGAGTTRIVLNLTGVEQGMSYPAHIHPGTYIDGKFDFDPNPKYALEDAVNGVSDTTLPVTFAEFTAQDYLVAAHHPHEEGQGAGVDPNGKHYGRALAAGPVKVLAAALPNTGASEQAMMLLLPVALGLALVGSIIVWRGRSGREIARSNSAA